MQAGNALDAACECENLENGGITSVYLFADVLPQILILKFCFPHLNQSASKLKQKERKHAVTD